MPLQASEEAAKTEKSSKQIAIDAAKKATEAADERAKKQLRKEVEEQVRVAAEAHAVALAAAEEEGRQREEALELRWREQMVAVAEELARLQSALLAKEAELHTAQHQPTGPEAVLAIENAQKELDEATRPDLFGSLFGPP